MRCNSGWLFPADGRRSSNPRALRPVPELEPGPASRPDLARWQGQHPCVGLADEIIAGTLRVLVVAGGNPLTAFPEPDRTTAALARLDALVVLDVVASELTELATHVFPTTGQLERADVSILENVAFTNGNRHTPAVVAPGAYRRPAWWVIAQLAHRLGLDVLGGADPDTCDDETLLAGIAAGSRGGYDALVAAGPHGIDAPVRTGWVHDQLLPEGRWNLAPRRLVERLRAMRDPDPDPGLVLVPRRRGASMNAARYGTFTAEDVAAVRMHPDDVTVNGLAHGASVELRSAHGRVAGRVLVDPTLRAGVVNCSHGDIGVNVANLVSCTDDVDAETGMPRASGLPVTVSAAIEEE
jgi:anaerobic selenocysteine-containing dehydrogenase